METKYWLVTHEKSSIHGDVRTTEATDCHPLEVLRLWESNYKGLATIAIIFAMPITKEAHDAWWES